MIKGIVFDFDGLILDTESAWFEALGEVYADYDAVLPLETWTQCIGTNHDAFDPYLNLAEVANRAVDVEEAKRLALEHHTRIMQTRTLRPGVLDYLKSAQQLGLKIGIASSSHLAWIEQFIHRFNIAEYFSCIRTADNVEIVKPNPELYIQALTALDLRPEETIAFEDSPNGAKAAYTAGLNVVIVPNTMTEGLTFGPHMMRLNSMAEQSLQEVIAFVSSNNNNK